MGLCDRWLGVEAASFSTQLDATRASDIGCGVILSACLLARQPPAQWPKPRYSLCGTATPSVCTQGSWSIHATYDSLHHCHSSSQRTQPRLLQRTSRCTGRRTTQCKASRQETDETLQPARRLRGLGSWLQKPKAPKPVPVDTKPPLRLPFQPEDPERGFDLSQLSYIWGLGILSVCYLHHSTTGYGLSLDLPHLKSVSRHADVWARQVCSASYAAAYLSRLEAHRQPGSSAHCGLHGMPSPRHIHAALVCTGLQGAFLSF